MIQNFLVSSKPRIVEGIALSVRLATAGKFTLLIRTSQAIRLYRLHRCELTIQLWELSDATKCYRLCEANSGRCLMENDRSSLLQAKQESARQRWSTHS